MPLSLNHQGTPIPGAGLEIQLGKITHLLQNTSVQFAKRSSAVTSLIRCSCKTRRMRWIGCSLLVSDLSYVMLLAAGGKRIIKYLGLITLGRRIAGIFQDLYTLNFTWWYVRLRVYNSNSRKGWFDAKCIAFSNARKTGVLPDNLC